MNEKDLMHDKIVVVAQACCQSQHQPTPNIAVDLEIHLGDFINTEIAPMAFNPARAPIYGGEVLEVNLGGSADTWENAEEIPMPSVTVSDEDELYLILKGQQQFHISTMNHKHDLVWLAPIPGHDCAERVYLSVVRRIPSDEYFKVAVGEFSYYCDSAYFLAEFLVNSVNNPRALDDLELIRSDHFDLANEILSTLDWRLSAALKHIQFPEDWHLLGSEPYDDCEPDCRETLLHLAGRLGLYDTALFLLTKPGGEDALYILNREGQLPCAVASSSGFDNIAELFSGYNTNGMVIQFRQQLCTDRGIIFSHVSAGTSLTVLSGATQNRTIESYIEELREMEVTMKRGRSPGLQRQYQTDWPSPPLPSRMPHNTKSTSEAEDTEEKVTETMERILREQRVHADALNQIVREYNPLNSNTTVQTGGSSPLPSPGSNFNISSEVMMEASRQYGLLEGSLSSAHVIREGLLKLRGYQLLQRRNTDAQYVRRLGLSRFSTSCPSLDAGSKPCPLSPIYEGDQHKSMQDLAQEVGSSPVASQSPTINLEDGFIAHLEDDSDSTVRICVNGVTVDSTEDFPLENNDRDIEPDKFHHVNHLSSSEDDEFRRRSWCPDSSGIYIEDGGDIFDGSSAFQGRTLAMTGKSLSLGRLTSEEELVESVQPSSQQRRQHSHSGMMVPRLGTSLDSAGDKTLFGGFQTPEEDLSFSSIDSAETSPTGQEVPDGQELMRRVNSEATAASPQAARSMSDLTSHEITCGERKASIRSLAGVQGVRSYEERRMLGGPDTPMSRSVSASSIPAAVHASVTDQKLVGRDLRREGKQLHEPSQLLYQKFAEEYDAQFRRQEEIEEEEEDTVEKKEITWKDFLNEGPTTGDSDEKSKGIGSRKEDKKRKPSVFNRIQNSYRTKKHKDKDNKVKHSHHFVAVSFSNATTCNVCHKPMANKPALRCENCLINVHEHSCKDQVSHCDKYSNMKVPQREGSGSSAVVQDRAASVLQGSGLKTSHSFKLKDKPSYVAKSQNSGSMSSASHRHSVPSTGYIGTPPPGTTYLQWFQATSRFSVVDKAISEADELDGISVGHDIMGSSNITDAISESLESLDTVWATESSILEEDPDLLLGEEEKEAWNITVDKKTLKKMTAKDVKRQDTIWACTYPNITSFLKHSYKKHDAELIQTEKQYVKRLKIMQKLFRERLMIEQLLTLEQRDRLFPCLDELYELQAGFLRSLLALQSVNADRSIEEIGPTLLKQFSEETADKMKSAYGWFCSKHTEAIQLYKEIAKTDRKFQILCRKISNLSLCEKRELPDFILGVTVRLSKYPILIEAILKSTKDKKDREQLSRALQCSRLVVHDVDKQVAAYEKLMEIYRAFDARTTIYMGEKFKRQDLIAKGRHLLHSGAIGWKNARNRVLDAYALVLTDIMVFLQKNEQKYTFFLQDNKPCVLPLSKLLVREKRDERESHGIYVICQNRSDPEMYQLVCRTREDRDQWIKILQDAIKNCPEEEDIQQQRQEQQPEAVTEEERKKQEEKARKIKVIIDQLHQKDAVLKDLCEQKNQLMVELMECSSLQDESSSGSNSHCNLNDDAAIEVVKAAINEASRLTTIIQGSALHHSTQLSRSISSAGEHVSMSYVNMLMPKRAETFAGFDSSYDIPKLTRPSLCAAVALVNKRLAKLYGDEEGRSSSELSLISTDTIPEDSESSVGDHFSIQGGQSLQSFPSSSSSSLPYGSSQARDTSPGDMDSQVFDASDHSSVGEISASSFSSVTQPSTQPNPDEQMISIVQLVKYLHNIMNLTAKQNTTVESLRAELAEAKEEISKLSQDIHGQRRSGYRHNQLEELRNLQENISRERQEWERIKEREQETIRQEKAMLEAQRKYQEKQEIELRSKKEDLKREREMLHRQMDMLRDHGLLMTSTLTDSGHVVQTIDLDSVPSSSEPVDNSVPSHRRSASADFSHGTSSQPEMYRLVEAKGVPRVPRHQNYSVAGNGGKPNIPVHLMSARNEQKLGGANMQQLPLKLSSGIAGAPKQQQAPQTVQQHLHARTSSLSSLGSRSDGNPASKTPAALQAQGLNMHSQHSRSTPSSLSMLMKLAEPGSKGQGAPQANSSGSSASLSSVPLSDDGKPIFL